MRPSFGLPNAPVRLSPPFGKDGLGHARLGRHLDVAGQHLAIERVVVTAADEIAAQRADKGPERPDAGPFAHCISQRGAFGGEPCDQHVIHVGAVVHHEDDRRVLGDRGQRVLIRLHEAHTVERLAEEPRGADGEGEVGEGGKARHDFAGIAFGGLEGHVLADVVAFGVFGNRLGDLRVVDQAAHRIHAARKLERLDRAIETLVELRNRVFQAAAQIPADGGEQEMRRERHCRKQQDQDK
jgi:hypothetical protein